MSSLAWYSLRLRYHVGPNTRRRSVGGESATFEASSFPEFLRIVDFQNESEVIKQLLEVSKEDDVFWDIGANIGTHSCYVGKVVSEVVSFEPHPENALRAQKHLEENDVDGKVLEYALGSERKKATLSIPEGDDKPGVGTFTLRNDRDESRSIDVKVIPADCLIENIGISPPDIVKIDVEGSELDVIRGFQKGLKNARVILVEVHPEYVSVDEIQDVLSSKGYSVNILRHRSGEIQLIARNQH